MLTTENCKYIASQISKFCDNDGDNLAIRNLKSSIKKLDTAIENLWNSLERGENTDMITERINTRTAEKEKLQIELDKELNRCTVLSETQILAFLDYVKNLPNDDINKKRAIINIFVNAIYLYDDHFDIVFNASNQMMEIKNIPIDDIKAAFNGCSDAVHRGLSIKDSAPPVEGLDTQFENKVGTKSKFFTRPKVCLWILVFQSRGSTSNPRIQSAQSVSFRARPKVCLKANLLHQLQEVHLTRWASCNL